MARRPPYDFGVEVSASMPVFGKYRVVAAVVIAAFALVGSVRLFAPVSAVAASIFKITEMSLGVGRKAPEVIVVGSDHNMWITNQIGNSITKLTVDGQMTEYPIHTANAEPMEGALGPDGNVWFAEYGPFGKLGRIAPDGHIDEFPVLTPDARLWSVVTGPDGNLWFTEFSHHAIGRMARDGSNVVEYTTPLTVANPADITVGPDNNVWFTEWGGDQIGRITVTGTITITEFPLRSGSGPIGIVSGPDGNLWFVESGGSPNGNKVGKMNTQGQLLAEYPTPTQITDPHKSGPVELTVGPDGNIWIVEGQASKIASVTMDGQITEYDTPTAGSFPSGITTGPDGRLWFIEEVGDQVGVIDFAKFTYLPVLQRSMDVTPAARPR
jgi:virginiamycin B lyase